MASVSATDIDLFQESFTYEQIPLLIQLRQLATSRGRIITGGDDLETLLSKLGFSPVVADEITNNQFYANDVVKHLDETLKILRKDYEARYGLYQDDVDITLVRRSLFDDQLNLQTRAMLVNPFSILTVEKSLNLPNTGDIGLLRINWNKKYYSSRLCQEFNSDAECAERAAMFGDLLKLQQLYASQPRKSQLIEAAIQGGQIEILKYIVSIEGCEAIFSSPFNLAIRQSFDNTKMMEYLWSTFPATHVGISHSIAGIMTHNKPHIANIRLALKLTSQISDQREINSLYVKMLPLVVKMDWIDLFEEIYLITNFQNIPGYIINHIIALIATNGHMDLLKLVIDNEKFLQELRDNPSFLIKMITSSPRDVSEIIKYLLDLLDPPKREYVIDHLSRDGYRLLIKNGTHIANLDYLLSLFPAQVAERKKKELLSGIASLEHVSDQQLRRFDQLSQELDLTIGEWYYLHVLAMTGGDAAIVELTRPHASLDHDHTDFLWYTTDPEIDRRKLYAALKLPFITKDDIFRFMIRRLSRPVSEGYFELIRDTVLSSNKVSQQEMQEFISENMVHSPRYGKYYLRE